MLPKMGGGMRKVAVMRPSFPHCHCSHIFCKVHPNLPLFTPPVEVHPISHDCYMEYSMRIPLRVFPLGGFPWPPFKRKKSSKNWHFQRMSCSLEHDLPYIQIVSLLNHIFKLLLLSNLKGKLWSGCGEVLV